MRVHLKIFATGARKWPSHSIVKNFLKSVIIYLFLAGKSSSSEEVEDMLEKENVAIFTSGVSTNNIFFCLPIKLSTFPCSFALCV
jgi:hypothetical protein